MPYYIMIDGKHRDGRGNTVKKGLIFSRQKPFQIHPFHKIYADKMIAEVDPSSIKFDINDSCFARELEVSEIFPFYEVSTMEKLLENGADFSRNIRLLYGAIENGFLPCVKWIINHEADVHSDRDTALIRSIWFKRHEIASFLLEECGADVHTECESPLIFAFMAGDIKMIKLLIEHGADINACCEKVTRIAAKQKNNEIIDLLSALDE